MTKQEMIDFLLGDAVFVGDVIGEIVDYIEHSEKVVRCKDCKMFGNCIPGDGMLIVGITNGYCAAGKREDGEHDDR